MHIVDAYIEGLALRYKYRPLPKKICPEVYNFYLANMNGFVKKRPAIINGVNICKKYDRIVVGDYGAYVEIAPEDLTVTPTTVVGQEWRHDKDYVKKRGLNLKYYWMEYDGKRVYLQIAPVTYADYKPGYYYICTSAFDTYNLEETS